MPLSPCRRRFACLATLLLLCGVAFLTARADPSPMPDPRVEQAKQFAKRVIDAPDDTARRRLLADAPADLRDAEILRRQFNFQVGLIITAGDYPRAEALLSFTRRWCEECKDGTGIALVDWGAGNLEGTRGNLRASANFLAAARKFFAANGDRRREASVTTNQSIVFLELGDYRQALAGLESALAIHREMGNRDFIASDLQTIGNVYLGQGLTERAFEYWRQALVEAAENEDMQESLFGNLGTGYAAGGDLSKAIEQMENAIALARKLSDQPSEGLYLTTLARYEQEAGQPDKADRMFREALAISKKLGNNEQQAANLAGIADVLAQRTGNPETAAEALRLAILAAPLARESGDAEQIIQECTLLGRLLRLAGRRTEADAALAEAIDAVEYSRARLTGGDVTAAAFFAGRLAPYQEKVALLADGHRPADALAFAEQAKARVLLETMRGGPRNGIDETFTPTERATLQERAQTIAALNRELAVTPPTERAPVEERLRHARLAREAAEDAVLDAHPELRRFLPPRRQAAALTPSALGSLLEGGGVLVEYSVGQDETLVFLVRWAAGNLSPATEVFRLPLGRKELEDRTRHYRRLVSERGLGWEREARALGEDLLGPLRPVLADENKLVIVPDGPLWEMPFQTLPTARGTGVLTARDTLASKKLSLAPSLGFLLQARTQTASRANPGERNTRLLAFGNPAMGRSSATAGRTALRDDELSPLPDAEREVLALGKLYGPSQSEVLVGSAATEEAFRRDASRCGVLHFATHGVFNNQSPLYSHLLLAQTDLAPGEDGLLEAWELMRQPLHARLAVLSACETARGRIGAGEGVIGLSWALFAAGCPSCVVSQWKVDSAGSTDLMVEFHRQLISGSGRAEALQQASLHLAANPEMDHPFYWAPFVLIGDGD